MNEIQSLIKQLDAGEHEVDWFGPVSNDSIENIESLLGIQFPPSYRTFLCECGGGGVGDSYISGINEEEPTSTGCGTVYGDTLCFRKERGLPDHLIVLESFVDDDYVAWCLDIQGCDGPEFPVVCVELYSSIHTTFLYTNFLEYFKDYVKNWTEE